MSTSKDARRGDPPAAQYVGRDNAVAVIGRSWRAVQDLAGALGVRPRRVGRIALYLAAELVAAIEKANEPAVEPEVDELESMRERVRRAG